MNKFIQKNVKLIVTLAFTALISTVYTVQGIENRKDEVREYVHSYLEEVGMNEEGKKVVEKEIVKIYKKKQQLSVGTFMAGLEYTGKLSHPNEYKRIHEKMTGVYLGTGVSESLTIYNLKNFAREGDHLNTSEINKVQELLSKSKRV